MQGQKVVNKMITCAYKMNYNSNGSPLYPIPFDRVVACSDSPSTQKKQICHVDMHESMLSEMHHFQFTSK